MRVLANNIDLINLRNQLLENNKQRRLEKHEETLKQKKKSLVELSKKSIDKQVAKYKNFEELVNDYKTHQIANDKIEQIMSIEKLNDEIIYYQKLITKSNNYAVRPSDLSKSKLDQYKLRLKNLKNNTYNDLKKFKWDRFNTRLYTATEWIAEDWALKNNLPYHDYNKLNQRAPQDCKLNGIDIDVKTTLGVGCRNITSYYSNKGTTHENEIILGITSWAKKTAIIGTSEDISYHTIQGVFDPSLYSNIKLKLNHFPVATKLVNACYFQSLQSYFNLKPKYKNIITKCDDDIINYLVEAKNQLSSVFYLILNYFPEKIESALKLTLPKIHHDLIAIIIELNSKNLLALFPHYLVDYLIGKILDQKEIHSETINYLISSILWLHEDQQTYIKNLVKISNVLPEVRCKFHNNETMHEMDIQYLPGPIPTFRAQCSKEPTNKTTIFTYSWKTGETLIYGDSGVEVCDSNSCGCLTHMEYGIRYGRKTCKKYGAKSQKIIRTY